MAAKELTSVNSELHWKISAFQEEEPQTGQVQTELVSLSPPTPTHLNTEDPYPGAYIGVPCVGYFY